MENQLKESTQVCTSKYYQRIIVIQEEHQLTMILYRKMIRIYSDFLSKNINIIMKTTQKVSTRNFSHRYLIKQKTKQLFYYPQIKPIPKSAITLGLKIVDMNNTFAKNLKTNTLDDHQTSICLDDVQSRHYSNDQVITKSGSQKNLLSGKDMKGKSKKRFRNKFSSYKSVQNIGKVKNSQFLFDVKKVFQDKIKQKEAKSMQNLQNQQKISNRLRVSTKQLSANSQSKIKEATITQNIKSRLHKQSVSRMKPKVVDPFRIRSKLDLQFENLSTIKITEQEQSFVSIQNKEQFNQMLNKIL